jgi:steroid delta-isomerase-like uncharacterized protein
MIMSQRSLIDIAKGPNIAYGKKDWEGVRASVTPDVHYDEIATHRKMKGVDPFLAVLQGWAKAFPDSKATHHNAVSGGTTVVLELTWHGTHTGPLQTPEGSIAATGKPIEIPACMVVEIGDGKAKSIRHYFDMATLMQQLGISKAA